MQVENHLGLLGGAGDAAVGALSGVRENTEEESTGTERHEWDDTVLKGHQLLRPSGLVPVPLLYREQGFRLPAFPAQYCLCSLSVFLAAHTIVMLWHGKRSIGTPATQRGPCSTLRDR